jgi:hypothetical protein
MKKQTPEASKPVPMKIGDKVLTFVSLRPAEIIKIEEKRGDYRDYGGCEEYREITVKIPMPMLDQPYFRDVTMVCRESELTKTR